MRLDQLKPNVIVRGPIFPEPVQVIATVPMGKAIKLIGKGLKTGQVHDPVLRSHWDLIIVDEAHKMSAYGVDKKTLAYQLGESLSQMTDHYLLMTATPHKGDAENFCRFLALLDPDVYGDVTSLEEAMRRNSAPFYLRRTKEALVTFPDPDTGADHDLARLYPGNSICSPSDTPKGLGRGYSSIRGWG